METTSLQFRFMHFLVSVCSWKLQLLCSLFLDNKNEIY